LQHVGLALATSLSAFLNAGLLLMGLLKAGVFRWQPGWGVYLARLMAALLSLGVVIMLLNVDKEVWLQHDVFGRIVLMLKLVVAGVAAYFMTLLLCGLRIRHIRA